MYEILETPVENKQGLSELIIHSNGQQYARLFAMPEQADNRMYRLYVEAPSGVVAQQPFDLLSHYFYGEMTKRLRVKAREVINKLERLSETDTQIIPNPKSNAQTSDQLAQLVA